MGEDKILSINNYMNLTPNWKNDEYQIVKIGTRCGAVFDAYLLSLDIVGSVTKDDLKQFIDLGINDIYVYSVGGLVEFKKVMPVEVFSNKYNYWVDLYKKMGNTNHEKHNDFFAGMLGDDMQSCLDNYKLYQNILEQDKETSKIYNSNKRKLLQKFKEK